MRSWERKNVGWQFRCLDAQSVELYAPIRQYIDSNRQPLTAASLSDVLRILLLHEFGGVWVDATLYCNRPLDEWLPQVMQEGFFAFAAPAPDRLLSSWLLAAAPGNYLVSIWCARTIEYCPSCMDRNDYFWFHHLFQRICETDPKAAHVWSRVPKLSADGPHAIQFSGAMYSPWKDAAGLIDWTTPVFKLTHRLREGPLDSGCLLGYLLADYEQESATDSSALGVPENSAGVKPAAFASLKVSTENLGDHIQIIAGLRLLSKLGVEPSRYIDRDNEISSAPGLDEDGSVGILLSGWFKTNRSEWPPNPKLVPLIYSFHIRLFQCPELVSKESIEFFRQNQPIGCRDSYTEELLRAKGVDAFTSNCLSMTFPRRLPKCEKQTEVFVVSRDERLKDYLPELLGPYTFVSHYSGSTDFAANITRAEELLETYGSRARLMVTTLLHCALPAIAMGIPVIVFYPLNDPAMHASDCERFSSLDGIVRIYRLDEMGEVNWNPAPIDVSELKLRILEGFYAMSARWKLAPPVPLAPIAPASALPPP